MAENEGLESWRLEMRVWRVSGCEGEFGRLVVENEGLESWRLEMKVWRVSGWE